MMKSKQVVITGAAPDYLTRQTCLRRHVAEGFGAVCGDSDVANVPLEVADDFVRQARPRLVLVVGSCLWDQCDYAPLRGACDQVSCPLAFWCCSDPHEFDAAAKIVRLADYIFSNDRWAAEHYHRDRVCHLPLAASPSAHGGAGPSVSSKCCDVLFIGSADSFRRGIIKDLARTLARVRTAVVGVGWNAQDGPFCRHETIAEVNVTEQYRGARVVLNMTQDLHPANNKYHLVPSSPGAPIFEAAMAGACQLIFADSLEVLHYFDANDEVLLFDGPQDFEHTLSELLRNPLRCEALGAAARKRCMRDHTYAARARVLLERIGVGTEKPTGVIPAQDMAA